MSSSHVPPATSTQGGDEYICQLAQYIRLNSRRLSTTGTRQQTTTTTTTTNNGSPASSPSSWMASTFLLGGSGTKTGSSHPKPLTLTISCYHLYYVLLRIQEAGFADIGDIDVKLEVDRHRRPAAGSNAFPGDSSDARSIKTGWTFLSTGATSLGSGWWGASSSSSSTSSRSPEKNLKFIYTAFTLLPSLKLVLRDNATKGKHKEVEGFPFVDYPGDRMVPMRAFKSLQRLEVQGVDARSLLFTQEWQGLQTLQIRDAGLENLTEILAQPQDKMLQWPSGLRVLDVENNDITGVDATDLAGLEMLRSLSLRKNLLITVPSALVNLTSLRSLDLSENMIDSVLAIYKSLGAVQILSLRANRISSLCGLERLLSLEVLDLRDNDISDAAELGRLAVLPHLRELYVQSGNPFVDDPSAKTTNGWRIDLFDAFLREATPAHGLTKDNLLSIDGFPPSWNEKRYLAEPSGSGFAGHRSPRPATNHQGTRTHSLDEPASHAVQHTIVSPRRTRQSASAGTPTRMRNGSSAANSPPPPVPEATIDVKEQRQQDGSLEVAGNAEDRTENTKPTPHAKIVKRKHKRIVDLDGTAVPPNHSRSASTPQHSETKGGQGFGGDKGPTGRDSEESSKGGHFHTLSSHPSGSRNGSRTLSQGTFDPPHPASSSKNGKGNVSQRKPDPGNSGSGSEADEFRRKMEKLRDEVGVENWLSVYSSASATNASRTDGPRQSAR